MSLREDIDLEQFLASLQLASGGHDSPDEGMCLLEATAFLAGEPHSLTNASLPFSRTEGARIQVPA